MARFLFDIFPASGHYNASYRLAAFLKKKGHEVVFFSDSVYGRKTSDQGYKVITCEQRLFSSVLSDWSGLNRVAYTLNILTTIFSKRIIKALWSSIIAYQNLVKSVKADYVFLDTHLSQNYIVYASLHIKVYNLQTMVDSSRAVNYPPMCSARVPDNGLLSKVIINGIWFGVFVKRYFQNLTIKLKHLSHDYKSLYIRASRCMGNPVALQIDKNQYRGSGIGLKNVDELIVSSFYFDFPHALRENRLYFNLPPKFMRNEPVTDSRYIQVMREISMLKQKDITKGIIYCSFGTLTHLSIRKCKVFFNRLLRVANNMPQYAFIVSTGKGFNPGVLHDTSENVYLFPFLPQMNLLSVCDVMISHGGMNSIMECIFHEVPLLVYPLTKQWDQKGNAARIVYHGLGLKGNVSSDSAGKIKKYLEHILSNKDAIQIRTKEMKRKILDNYIVPGDFGISTEINHHE